MRHFASLFKKDCLQKPDTFNEENDVEKQITEVNNYCTNIGLEEEGAKCCVLRETLPFKNSQSITLRSGLQEQIVQLPVAQGKIDAAISFIWQQFSRIS